MGLTVGYIFAYFIKREGRSLVANLTWGTVGAVAVGSIAIGLGFGDGLLFSFVGSLCVLFIANAFHQHHQEDLHGHVDLGIRIKR
ncbi:hypothetical protein ACG2F4_13075 [Halalkalibaculum sp. DA3122]|uniref:hypothetical protein n=1 Tax=unclassified Halalkalibaculum TaxID=2964617 RepID=UPI0037548615